MNRFDFNKIENFNEHINLSIPNYNGLINQIVKLSDYFIDDGTNVFDLGCSTGKMFDLFDINDNVSYIGVDNSNLLPKRETAKNISYLNEDLLEYEHIKNASLILSVFTLQFLPRAKRKMMINKVKNGLNKKGAFIICEKTYSENAMLQDITNSLYYKYKEENFEVSEILQKERQLRKSVKLNTLDEIKSELQCIGDVEVFWRSYNFAGLIVIKD